MPTLDEAREIVYQRFVSEWDVSDAVYTLENEAFTPPASGPWVRVSVRALAHSQETLGAEGQRRYRQVASANVEVFVPINTGTRQLGELCQSARSAFLGRSLGDTVKFYDGADVQERGPDGKWISALVTARFEYEEVA